MGVRHRFESDPPQIILSDKNILDNAEKYKIEVDKSTLSVIDFEKIKNNIVNELKLNNINLNNIKDISDILELDNFTLIEKLIIVDIFISNKIYIISGFILNIEECCEEILNLNKNMYITINLNEKFMKNMLISINNVFEDKKLKTNFKIFSESIDKFIYFNIIIKSLNYIDYNSFKNPETFSNNMLHRSIVFKNINQNVEGLNLLGLKVDLWRNTTKILMYLGDIFLHKKIKFLVKKKIKTQYFLKLNIIQKFEYIDFLYINYITIKPKFIENYFIGASHLTVFKLKKKSRWQATENIIDLEPLKRACNLKIIIDFSNWDFLKKNTVNFIINKYNLNLSSDITINDLLNELISKRSTEAYEIVKNEKKVLETIEFTFKKNSEKINNKQINNTAIKNIYENTEETLKNFFFNEMDMSNVDNEYTCLNTMESNVQKKKKKFNKMREDSDKIYINSVLSEASLEISKKISKKNLDKISKKNLDKTQNNNFDTNLYLKTQKEIEAKVFNFSDSIEFSIEKSNHKSVKKINSEDSDEIYKEIFDDSLLFQLKGKNIKLDWLIQKLYYFAVAEKAKDIKYPIYIPYYYDFRGRLYPKSSIGYTYMKFLRPSYIIMYECVEDIDITKSIYYNKIINSNIELKSELFDKNINNLNKYYLIIHLIELGKHIKNINITENGLSLQNLVDLGIELFNSDYKFDNLSLNLDEFVYVKNIKENINFFLKTNKFKNILIIRDSTASFLQHWGIHLNIKKNYLNKLNIDGNVWYDIYTLIIFMFKSHNNKYNNILYEPILKRKILKNFIMIVNYNAGKKKCSENLINILRENNIDIKNLDLVSFCKDFHDFINKDIFDFIFINSKDEFLEKMGNIIHFDINTSINFTYLWANSYKDDIKFANLRWVVEKYTISSDICKHKTKIALNANIIQASDAALARFILKKLNTLTVHDSFGIHLYEIHKLMDTANLFFNKKLNTNTYSTFILI